MSLTRQILLLIFSLISSFVFAQNKEGDNGGLHFDIQNKPNLRSTYEVFKEGKRSPTDSLSVEFGLILSPNNVSIGNILTCIENSDEVFNLMVHKNLEGIKNNLYFRLNLKRYKKQLTIALNSNHLESNWLKIKIKLDKVNRRINFSINQLEQFCEIPDITDSKRTKTRLIFGRYKSYTDISDFTIRNLQIGLDKDKLLFPLNETSGEIVHSSTGKAFGTTFNTTWMSQQHYTWQLKAQICSNEQAAVYQDEEQDQVVIVTSDTTYIYSPSQGIGFSNLRKKSHNSLFTASENGDFNYIWLPDKRKLVMYNKAYTVEECKIIDQIGHGAFYAKNLCSPKIAIYDPAKENIEIQQGTILGDRYHQSSVFYIPEKDMIYEFGGYSSFKFFNHIKYQKLDSFEWKDVKFKGDKITPRFFSSIATKESDGKSLAYLFGGYGNPLGNQDYGGESYYDFFELDPAEERITKLGEFTMSDQNLVPCRDMILSPDNQSFCTLCYAQHVANTSLQLYQFNLPNKSIVPLGSQIPLISEQIMTQISLFRNLKNQSLIAVIQEFISNKQSNIKVYQLNVPVYSIAEWNKKTMESNPCSDTKQKRFMWIFLTILILSGLIWWILKKGKKSAPIELIEDENQPVTTEATKNNSIFLLGEFTVFDKEGNDISYLFSDKIKQLFLLILLNTYRNSSKGIASKEISCIMWPEKELVESKNVRGVTFTKLRNILARMDGIEIVNSNKKWFIEIESDTCHCDFISIMQANMDELKDYNDIRPYIHILRRGSLLASEEHSWLDSFKAEFEECILKKMETKMNNSFEQSNYLCSYKISEVLLKQSPLDEDLIKIEVNSLIKLGDIDKARAKFRQFANCYREAYAVELNFEDFVM